MINWDGAHKGEDEAYQQTDQRDNGQGMYAALLHDHGEIGTAETCFPSQKPHKGYEDLAYKGEDLPCRAEKNRWLPRQPVKEMSLSGLSSLHFFSLERSP